jgi:hypothetical protein
VSDTRLFAAARGLSLPASGTAGDTAIEVLLTKALDYIEAKRAELQGSKLSAGQALQWPRADVSVDGFAVDKNTIPACLVQAQMRLACYAQENGGTLTVVSDGHVVIEERVEGAVDTKYADHGDSNPQPKFPEADALLDPLLKGGSSMGFGVAVRV